MRADLFFELNPRLELGDAVHPVGTYIYIPSKSPFGKGRLWGSLVQSDRPIRRKAKR